MKVFHFRPTEDPDAFNDALADFCAENDVVNIEAYTIHDGLWLNLIEADDLPGAPLLLSPFILTFSAAELPALAQRVMAAKDEVDAQSTDDNPQVVVKAQPLIPEGFKGLGYMLMVTVVGVLEDDAPGADAGEQS